MIRLSHFISPVTRLWNKTSPSPDLRVVPRDDHSVSRNDISEPALKVLYRLHKAGYQALLVGGGVRDTLLGLHPKDFDVATDATPEQVHKLFRNSRLIGRRFKLVHVVFGREVIEVATFRAPPQQEHSKQVAATGDQGMILRDNVYGSKDEDAMRRDFTINALYYNIADFSVHAYAGGWDDLQRQTIRLIGDPEQRYREDPVRMLRAIRFAAKLDFSIEAATEAPIKELAPLLLQIPPARLFEEVLKLFLNGKALDTLRLLRQYQLFGMLFPATEECLQESDQWLPLVEHTMGNTDQRIGHGKSVTPYFFLAALMWLPLCKLRQQYEEDGLPPHQAIQKAADKVIMQQAKHTAIPKRFSIPMREIWELQLRLSNTQPKRVRDVATHPRFRAAYDFVLLREQAGEDLGGLGNWWTNYQQENPLPEREQVKRDYKKPRRKPRSQRPGRSD